MEPTSDIESIIRSQLWKRPAKSLQNSPRIGSTIKGPSSPSIKLAQTSSTDLDEDLSKADKLCNSRERISELVKLAVPYSVLTQAIHKLITSSASNVVLINTPPKRVFGRPKVTFNLSATETFGNSKNCTGREVFKRKSKTTLTGKTEKNFQLTSVNEQ